MKVRFFTIPNILTLCNLMCGLLATVTVLLSMKANYGAGLTTAFYLLLAAVLFDFCDGFAARLLKQSSPIGVQLDSLADMVSSGVAPSAIMLTMYYNNGGEGYWGVACMTIALFSALRLAKFNIDTEQKDSFIGLPTPACALFMAAGSYFVLQHNLALPAWMYIALSVVFAVLLITPIRMFSLKFHGYSLRDPMNIVRYSLLLIAALSIAFFGLGAIAGIIILYIFTSIILNIFGRKKA